MKNTKIIIIEAKPSNSGSIHDLASDMRDRNIKIPAAAEFIIILSSYYGGRGFTTHASYDSAVKKAKQLRNDNFSFQIFTSDGENLDFDGWDIVDGDFSKNLKTNKTTTNKFKKMKKMKIETNVKISEEGILRINNDSNGNPRYYVDSLAIKKLPNHLQGFIKLPQYRGKKYGDGYVIQSYYLTSCLDNIVQDALAGFIARYVKSAMVETFENALADDLKTKYKSAKGYYKNLIISVHDHVIKKRGAQAACVGFLQGLGLDIAYSNHEIEKIGFSDPDQYWSLAATALKGILKLN